jgi:hypothetical protein
MLGDTVLAGSLSHQAILDSLAAQVSVVDVDGKVLAVNRRWVEFAKENGCEDLARVGVGSNYFQVCQGAAGESSERSQEALDGLRSVLSGHRAFFEMEYRCDSPTEERWFSMQVTPFEGDPSAVVVAHYNITFRKKQQFRLAEEAAEQSRDIELSHLRRFSTSMVAPTVARSYGLGPLSETSPQVYEELKQRYADLLDRAVDERVFQRGESFSAELRDIAALVGALNGGPRDLVGIHCDALKEKTEKKEGVRAKKASVYQEESRILLIELMGHLVSYYRGLRQTPTGGWKNRSASHGR